MSQKLYVKDSGVWKQVGIVYQKIAGVWTTLYIGKIKNSGTYKQFFPEVSGFDQWRTPGTYSFQVPAGIYNVKAVMVIGAGGGSGANWNNGDILGGKGGGSGGIRENVDFSVTPFEILTIKVGRGGFGANYYFNGGRAYFTTWNSTSYDNWYTNKTVDNGDGGVGETSGIYRGSTALVTASGGSGGTANWGSPGGSGGSPGGVTGTGPTGGYPGCSYGNYGGQLNKLDIPTGTDSHSGLTMRESSWSYHSNQSGFGDGADQHNNCSRGWGGNQGMVKLEWTEPTTTTGTYISATGGTVTTSGDYKIHTFTSNGQFIITTIGSVGAYQTVDAIIIGGGASGGGNRGGGGGAGGWRRDQSQLVSIGTYNIVVGGGAPSTSYGVAGQDGTFSLFSGINSSGGGGGGSFDPSNSAGRTGGSGGGGGHLSSPGTGGAGNKGGWSPVEGYDGGSGGGANGGAGAGGGGGASAVGAPNSGGAGGAGGAGKSSTITGSSVTLAGGGGGGGYGGAGGAGGAGGGGAGGTATHGTAAAANTGSGGGGSANSEGHWSGSGGGGIVIIKYRYQ
jgi:hypothetical protein